MNMTTDRLCDQFMLFVSRDSRAWKEAGRTRYIGVSLARPVASPCNNYADFHSLEAFIRAGYGRLPDEAMRKQMSEYLLSL